jgi:hypothetical protein
MEKPEPACDERLIRIEHVKFVEGTFTDTMEAQGGRLPLIVMGMKLRKSSLLLQALQTKRV